jgi:hypothetical protein
MIAEGYEDPMEDKGHRRCLIGEDPKGRTVRRFILGWGYGGTPPVPGQVKEKQTNDDWIADLKPRIIQNGGFKYIPFKDESNVIVNGHSRSRCHGEIIADPTSKIKLTKLKKHDYQMPWATVTDVYVLDEKGCPVQDLNAKGASAHNFVSKIQANPPKENDDYSREGVITQIDMLYRLDNQVMGLNPTGELLYDENDPENEEIRQVFDTIVDYVYKKESWTDKGQRTLIQQQLHKDHSVCKDIGAAEINEEAAVRGWPSGLVPLDPKKKNQKKSLKQIGDWISPDGKVLYVHLGTVGKHLQGKVGVYLDERKRAFTLNKLDAVKMVMSVSRPKTTIEGLNTSRVSYIKDTNGPQQLNQDYAAYNRFVDEIKAALPANSPIAEKLQKYPYIEEITFVEQLLREDENVPKDPGLIVKWDEKLERFRNQANNELI